MTRWQRQLRSDAEPKTIPRVRLRWTRHRRGARAAAAAARGAPMASAMCPWAPGEAQPWVGSLLRGPSPAPGQRWCCHPRDALAMMAEPAPKRSAGEQRHQQSLGAGLAGGTDAHCPPQGPSGAAGCCATAAGAPGQPAGVGAGRSHGWGGRSWCRGCGGTVLAAPRSPPSAPGRGTVTRLFLPGWGGRRDRRLPAQSTKSLPGSLSSSTASPAPRSFNRFRPHILLGSCSAPAPGLLGTSCAHSWRAQAPANCSL